MREGGDGGVRELEEVEENMACSDWAMGEWGSGSMMTCCSPGLEGMAAAFYAGRGSGARVAACIALYRQGRRGRSSWGRVCWGGWVLGEARMVMAARPAMTIAVASRGVCGGAWQWLVVPGRAGSCIQGVR